MTSPLPTITRTDRDAVPPTSSAAIATPFFANIFFRIK